MGGKIFDDKQYCLLDSLRTYSAPLVSLRAKIGRVNEEIIE
ncbi:hypothetical protein [Lederbergia ruris]|nr:hypothetical protein [Lederbergia ruris]